MEQKADITKTIEKYDADCSGKLDMQELRNILLDIDELQGFDPPGDTEVTTAFKMADVTNDGNIDRIELTHSITMHLLAKTRQRKGNNYHPAIHQWIMRQLKRIFG